MSVDLSKMTRKERARYMINEHIIAENAVLSGAQSYSIAGKSITRASLAEIRANKKYWEAELAMASGRTARKFKQFKVVDY